MLIFIIIIFNFFSFVVHYLKLVTIGKWRLGKVRCCHVSLHFPLSNS